MKLMLDLNVLLDIVQRRQPFYAASAAVLTRVILRKHSGFLPGHALTTLHYIVHRHSGQEQADAAVDWVLARLEIVAQDRACFIRARSLGFRDFEDAAVASAAEVAECDWIVTRNVADFESSPISAVTPEEFLVKEQALNREEEDEDEDEKSE